VGEMWYQWGGKEAYGFLVEGLAGDGVRTCRPLYGDDE
jgi:hypothetical protein